MEERAIPETPHLETAEPATLPERRTSKSSGNVSNGTSIGELPDKLEELGGRQHVVEQECAPKISSADHSHNTRHGRGPERRPHHSHGRSHASRRPGRSTGPTIRHSCSTRSASTSSDYRSSSQESDISSTNRSSYSSSSDQKRKRRRKGRKRKKSSSDSCSNQSRRSFDKLLHKGLCHSEHRLSRGDVRHTSLDLHREPRDKYDAIVDRLGAMAEGDGRKA